MNGYDYSQFYQHRGNILQRIYNIKTISDFGSLVEQIRKEHNAIYESQVSKQVECKKGCSFCCHLPVEISGIESVLLLEYLSTHSAKINKTRLIEQANNNWLRLKNIGFEEKVKSLNQCALLADDACIAYCCRPFPCMRFHSTNSAICIRSTQNPDLLVKQRVLPFIHTAFNSMLSIHTSLQSALNISGYDCHLYDLNYVITRLDDVKTIKNRFLKKKSIFESQFRSTGDVELSQTLGSL